MKAILQNLKLVFSSALAVTVLTGVAVGQTSWTPPRPHKPKVGTPAPPPPVHYSYGESFEKSIKADKAVLLSLCITEGRLKVNGWNRSEIRVYVEHGPKFAFNVRDKNPQSGDPNWVTVVGAEARGRYSAGSGCIGGGSVEVDVPMGAKVSITGDEFNSAIDSVRSAEIKTGGGSISIRNVPSGVTASNGQGDVTVESSAGPISLNSNTGNIIVVETKPVEIGDKFLAKTHSGTISLQDVMHRQVDVNSISGSILYNGVIRNGGSYAINTTKGSIRMALPADTACMLQATYGAGMFNTELALDIKTENLIGGPLKTVIGTYGKGGDARVKLTTSNGSISIKKQ